MVEAVEQNQKVILDKEYLTSLERKASFLEELLSFIEDRHLGNLMEETEKEENIPLDKAEGELKQ